MAASAAKPGLSAKLCPPYQLACLRAVEELCDKGAHLLCTQASIGKLSTSKNDERITCRRSPSRGGSWTGAFGCGLRTRRQSITCRRSAPSNDRAETDLHSTHRERNNFRWPSSAHQRILFAVRRIPPQRKVDAMSRCRQVI